MSTPHFNHIRLLRYASLFTYACVGIPLLQYETVVAEMLERVQARLDALYDECQRAAGGGQRMLLRQQSLAESLARVEALLSARERADFTQSQTP